MTAKEVKIQCLGYEIAADWYEESENSDEVLLVLYGYTSKRSTNVDLVSSIVNKTGMSALVVEYSGHGTSPYDLEELTPANNFTEVIISFDWLREKYPNKRISILGTSYGGFLATQLSKYRNFKKLVLRVPAIYPPNDFYTKWKDMPDPHFLKYRAFAEDKDNIDNHPLLSRTKKFTGNAFVIIHELDEFCPKVSTEAFAHSFDADVWTVKGLKHGLGEASEEQLEEYQNKIAEWLNK